jgi:hypothetical protein
MESETNLEANNEPKSAWDKTVYAIKYWIVVILFSTLCFKYLGSRHWFSSIGFNLPTIRVVYNQIGSPELYSLTECNIENGFFLRKDRLVCKVENRAGDLLEAFNFEIYDKVGFLNDAKGKPVKIQQGKVTLPSLSSGEIGKMEISIDDASSSDSIVLY